MEFFPETPEQRRDRTLGLQTPVTKFEQKAEQYAFTLFRRLPDSPGARLLTWFLLPAGPCNSHNESKWRVAASSRDNLGIWPAPAQTGDHVRGGCSSASWNVVALG
jgi:hypothetical protein